MGQFLVESLEKAIEYFEDQASKFKGQRKFGLEVDYRQVASWLREL